MADETIITLPQEAIDKLVAAMLQQWIDDPPYELRRAIDAALAERLKDSPIIDEVVELVAIRLTEQKSEIAEIAVRGVIAGMGNCLRTIYQNIASAAAKKATDAIKYL